MDKSAAVTATNRPALGTFPNAPGAPAGSGGYSVPYAGNRAPGFTTSAGGHYWVNGSGRPFMTLDTTTASYSTTTTDVAAKQIRCQYMPQPSDVVTVGSIRWASDNAYPAGTFGDSYHYDTTQYVGVGTAQNACPTGWRLPTQAEMQDLVDTSIDSQWMDNFYPGINGWLFTTPNGDELFFTASGVDAPVDPNGYQGSSGYYWSSTTGTLLRTGVLSFTSGGVSVGLLTPGALPGTNLSAQCVQDVP